MFSTPRRSPASWIRIEPLLQWAEQGFEVQAKSERLGTALELHSGLALFLSICLRLQIKQFGITPVKFHEFLM